MATYCKNFRGILHHEKTPHKQVFTRARCKMWACPYCWKANQAQWRAVLFKQLPLLSGTWSFHTITLKSSDHKHHRTAQKIKSNWDTLMKRLKRLYGKFSYVRVLEQHKTGAWHIHLLASFHIAQDDLKTVKNKDGTTKYQYSAKLKREVFPECGFGKISSVSNLNEGNSTEEGVIKKAIGYVTKYMTKRDDDFETVAKSEKLRIIQTSRDIKFKPDKRDDDEKWNIKHGIYPIEVVQQTWIDLNRGGEVVTLDHFKGSDIYPNDALLASDDNIT